jgi:hypothetical protein
VPHGVGSDRVTPVTGRRMADQARRVREALWALGGVRPSGDFRRAMYDLETADLGLVAREAEGVLGLLVARLWHEGWQPAELARHGRRKDPPVGRIVTAAIAADHVRRDRRSLHPQWAAQADALAPGATPDGWLLDVIEAERYRGGMRRLLIVRSIALLASVRPLPTILPPPGSDPATWDRADSEPGTVDEPVLAKVRALLAQAESTTFEAEAEAFTAKAQELMARHAIDVALVWSRSDRKTRPTTIRLPIDDPYADQKSLLLQIVAEHSQCKAVFHTPYGLQSVVGFASDVAATELLFTSLLVQSQAAVQAEAATAPPGSRVRGRSFRASFLHAYAQRIDQRLAEINRDVQATVEAEQAAAVGGNGGDGSSLLPALVARRDAVDAEVEATFGELVAEPVRGRTDALGWVRGGLAADRAELNPSVAASSAPPPAAPAPTSLNTGQATLF